MVIGIDYDDTWTKDPKFWRAFCHSVLNHTKHQIVMVTQRCECWPEQVKQVHEDVGENFIPIVFAGDPVLPQSKIEAARHAGWMVDVWIDDNPISVTTQMYRIRERGYDVGEEF